MIIDLIFDYCLKYVNLANNKIIIFNIVKFIMTQILISIHSDINLDINIIKL
jgi:hypothetical protein